MDKDTSLPKTSSDSNKSYGYKKYSSDKIIDSLRPKSIHIRNISTDNRKNAFRTKE